MLDAMGASSKDSELAKQLIESGSSVAGAATGAALGLFGGPAGVVAGAAAGAMLTDVIRLVGADMRQRLLGPREEIRVGAALAFAASSIQDRLSRGDLPREDGFLASNSVNRSSAEEILEGVLLAARDAYEERKVQLLGKLFAGLAFAPGVGPAEANHLVSLAGRLTYRQLCALGVAAAQGSQGPLMHKGDYQSDSASLDDLDSNAISLLTEIYDLGQGGLITTTSNRAWLDIDDIEPGRLRTYGAGTTLTRLMGLDQLPVADLQSVVRTFPGRSRASGGTEAG